jgi:hypothetical protein
VAPEARVSRNPRPGCPASSATGSARYLKPKANRRLCLTRLWAGGFAHVPEHRISVAVAAIGQPRNMVSAPPPTKLRPLPIKPSEPPGRKLDTRGYKRKTPAAAGVKFGRATRCQARRKMDYAMIRRQVVRRPIPCPTYPLTEAGHSADLGIIVQ